MADISQTDSESYLINLNVGSTLISDQLSISGVKENLLKTF
jgi:hypothetical protein